LGRIADIGRVVPDARDRPEAVHRTRPLSRPKRLKRCTGVASSRLLTQLGVEDQALQSSRQLTNDAGSAGTAANSPREKLLRIRASESPRSLLIVLALFMVVLAGCASNIPTSASPPAVTPAASATQPVPPPATRAPLYSHREYNAMTTCVGLTDNAYSIAVLRLKGRSLADVKSLYDATETAKLMLPLVDKVYGDKVPNAWEYAVAFFSECALNMGDVPASRSGLAGYCMQNGMIASIAARYRDGETPKNWVYEQFAPLGETPKGIIDRVYAASKSRAEAELDAWKVCMAPITEASSGH